MGSTKQAKPDLVPVVELIRTSTDRQDMARQRTSLDKRREMKPGQVIERLEIAFSGTKSLAELGAAGKRLVELAKAKAFRELRVSSYDRLIGARSMDPRLQAEIPGLCLDAGAVLIEADTGMEIQPGTLMGNAMAAFRGGASAQERIQHLSRTNQGRAQAAIAGRAPNGRPYGRRYNSDPLYRRWEYDPIEEPVLRELISWVMSGASIGHCQRELNRLRVLVESLVEQLRDGAKLDRLLDSLDERDDVLVRILRSERVVELLASGADPIAVVDRCFMPPLGGGNMKRRDGKTKTNRWWDRTISGLLRQRHLVGERTYTNKHREGWQHTYKVPAILTEAEFQALQDKLDRRSTKGRPVTRTNAVCQSRIYCACGKRIQVKVNGRGRNTYLCSTAHYQHKRLGGERCPYAKPREVSIVDNAAWAAIVAYLDGDPSVYADAASDAPDLAPYRKEVEDCQREIEAIKNRAAVVAKTFAGKTLLASALEKTIADLEADANRYAAREREARRVLARLEASQASRKSLAAAVDRARERVRSATDADRRAIVHELIPDEAGHGIFIGADGQVEIVLGLLAPADGTEGADGENAAAAGGSGRARSGAISGNAARRRTWRRSKRAASRSTAARMSTRSACSRTRC